MSAKRQIMSAKRQILCEIETIEAPPVGVGVHSYPGSKARRCRWFRSHASAMVAVQEAASCFA
eukprot:1919611-Rhodomonas_salina.2